jgi:hypothetical protein
MTAANYCWAVFIVGAFVLLARILMMRKPKPPKRSFTDEELAQFQERNRKDTRP